MPTSSTAKKTKSSTRKKTTKKTTKKSTRSKKSTSTPTAGKLKRATVSVPAGDVEITGYNTALRWLFTHTDYERMRIVHYNKDTFSLDRMKKLLDALGNPHKQLRCVQVAGTKGKGSCCAMLASMLGACGYTVGLYSSPHLVDLRERIKIGDSVISQNDLTEAFKLIASQYGKFKDDPPSFFEIMTATALRYFADQAVDVAVLETGLGGRLDSTTAVEPLAVGITNISLDHMNILGKTTPEIAREKAGTFKPGVPAISVEQEPEVAEVLESVANEVGCPLEFTGREIDFSYRFEFNRELGHHTRISVTTPTSRWEHLAVPLRGEHQAHNCGLALALLDKLKAEGFEIPEDQVIAGLAETQLDGRMEQVWDEPRVVIDGAHNAASITALIRALGAHIAYDSLVVIFGCGQDKDVNGMLKQLALGADKVIFTRAKSNPRAMEPEDLISDFGEVSGKMAQKADNLEAALKLASRAVSREDLIIVTGSFYLAGEAKKFFHDLGNKRKK